LLAFIVLLGACLTAPVPAKRTPRSARPAPVRAEPTPHKAAATPPKAVAPPPTAAFRELAEKIQALIVATLEHRTPPATLPLAKARFGGRRIESSDPLPPTAGLISLVFSIDMQFFFEPSGKALRVIFVLTPTGIKVAHLRVPSFLGSRPHPLPSCAAS
jgi:hypothetical protein